MQHWATLNEANFLIKHFNEINQDGKICNIVFSTKFLFRICKSNPQFGVNWHKIGELSVAIFMTDNVSIRLYPVSMDTYELWPFLFFFMCHH